MADEPTADKPVPEANEDAADAEAFWRLGPLGEPEPEAGGAPGLDLVGRPEITVDGRNLADVLRPVYTALTGD